VLHDFTSEVVVSEDLRIGVRGLFVDERKKDFFFPVRCLYIFKSAV
jgi:hypothetical protein